MASGQADKSEDSPSVEKSENAKKKTSEPAKGVTLDGDEVDFKDISIQEGFSLLQVTITPAISLLLSELKLAGFSRLQNANQKSPCLRSQSSMSAPSSKIRMGNKTAASL